MSKEDTTKVKLDERDFYIRYFSETKGDYELDLYRDTEKVDIYETYVEIHTDKGEYRYFKVDTEEDLIEIMAGSKVKIMWWNA